MEFQTGDTMKRLMPLLLTLVIAVPAGAAAVGASNPSTRPARRHAVLRAVLDVERQSQAFYRAVLVKHRPLHPFGMVWRMEISHEKSLVDAMKQQTIDVPEAAQTETIAAPDDTKECFAKAIEMEKQTIAAYDRAIERCRNDELRQVLQKLRGESVEHQKWFEDPSTCPMGGGGRGPGFGRGPR
jgi:hypothetical protein